MADFPESLVDAATEAIVMSWSPETEYDEAGHAATVAVLHALLDGYAGQHLCRTCIEMAVAKLEAK